MSFSTPLIQLTDKGLYCEAGQFYIDPSRAVETAVVTHAHSDHARRGAKQYICAKTGVGLLKVRLGKNINVQGVPYGQKIRIGKVEVSLHPAGHILGSAQVRIEHEGEVWVASGDYKRDADPSCEPFEVVKCDTFITEATFGTPKYTWDKNLKHGLAIYEWWQDNAAEGYNSVVFGYSLGKAQRILSELAPYASKPILIYETIRDLTECYREEGRAIAPTVELRDRVALEEWAIQGDLILAPPSALDGNLRIKLGKYRTAFASGWMGGSTWHRQDSYDHGFVMSDHADWNDLNQTIRETGASRVFVQHRNGALVRHLRKSGIDAYSDEDLRLDNYQHLGGTNLSLF
ncbi:MAG: ligase-associated DNA damage response exonuclease [Bdellovibrionales bacterium]|nr:ligase-associated DNA damage response exonuclease [Bdellovibrionales bacterium]